jgi:glycosyltransferase involved in cell wall biosynthesis
MWYERGVSYVAKQLAEGLEHTGRFRTYVLARWESERFQNRGSIYHPRVVNGGDDPSPKKTVAWAKQNGLDAVIFVEVHPKDWKRVDALQREGVTVIGYEHLDVLRLGEFDRYERLDGLLSSTFYGWREFKARFPDKPCLIVPWGIQPKLARQHLAPFQMAPTSGNGFVRFVHVAGWGGIGNRKNTDLVLRAFHETELQHARLRLYSQAPIEQYGDECVKIVRRDQRIELHQGTVDNIFRAYAHADVLLSPSKREGLGLPILEALACGIPTVISNGFTMAEWPIAGKHAVMCKAVPSQEQERVPRYLPLLEVDESDLAAALRGIGGSPHRLWEMKRDVARDRHFWLWTWQPRSLALQLQKLLEAGGGSIGDERGFLPAHIIDFEQRRAASRRPGNGEPPDQQSGGEDGSESRVAPIVSLRETPEGGSVRHLFITGCQRSGTTALLHLLNEDSRIVLGRERYKYCRTEITPEHFTEERFFSPRKSETNYLVEEFYDRLHDRWKQGNVRYIGDKVPFYYKDLFYLGETFPDCKVLFLVRDLERVAASYNARANNPEDRVWRENMDYRQAVVDWNESLQKLIDFAEAGYSNQVFVIPYEDFFSGREEQLKAIYDFLGLEVSEGAVSNFREMTSDWQERIARPTNLTAKMVKHLEERRDRELENRVVSLNPLPGSDSAERTG